MYLNRLTFDSEVTKMSEVNGKVLVKCAPTIYEIKTNKHGKIYKSCLSNKQQDQKLYELLKDFEEMTSDEMV